MTTHIVTEQRILEAAVHLFARQGINGTSTREIAALADINEGTIFRRFGTKNDLFIAAVNSQVQRLGKQTELRAAISSGQPVELVMGQVIEFVVDIVRTCPELIRLLYYSATEMGSAGEALCRDHLSPVFDTLKECIAHCRDHYGTDIDPLLATVSLIATVVANENLIPTLSGTCNPVSAQQSAAEYKAFWSKMLRA